MKALIRTQEADIAAGKRPRKGLDLDVGYHQELEASNKRLEMDNRLMAPRVSFCVPATMMMSVTDDA